MSASTHDEASQLRSRLDQLTHENAQLAAVLEHSADGVLWLAADGTITLVNHAFERLTGWTCDQVVGRLFAELLDPRDERDRPLDAVQYLLDGPAREDRRDLAGTVSTRSGTRLPARFALTALRDRAGTLTGAVLTLRDERRVESAEALRDSFVAVVSHELQTPLAIIKGYASTLARTDTEWQPEQLREGLAVIEEEADRLNRLVEDLLAVSRIQAFGLTADHVPVDLLSLARRLVHRFKAAHPTHRFILEPAGDVPMVLADHEKVEIALRNLLDNAAKYAPVGSTIGVSVRPEPDGRSVRTSVRDEGPGIPAVARERVFERFYRVDDSDTRQHRGAGLGLFLCRTIVEAHGGRIWVEPDAQPGTTVTFSLPID